MSFFTLYITHSEIFDALKLKFWVLRNQNNLIYRVQMIAITKLQFSLIPGNFSSPNSMNTFLILMHPEKKNIWQDSIHPPLLQYFSAYWEKKMNHVIKISLSSPEGTVKWKLISSYMMKKTSGSRWIWWKWWKFCFHPHF